MKDRCDIAIIGAGAAGLAAGIFAGEAAQAEVDRLPKTRSLGGPPMSSAEDNPPRESAAESIPNSNPLRIVLLDGAKTIGAKILVSGGGRCNVTHDQIIPEDYSGPRTIVRNVLAAFDERAAVRWMESMGVSLKREDTGKMFPVSDSARTVLVALLNRLDALGVEVRGECRVIGVERAEPSQAGISQFVAAENERTAASRDASIPPAVLQAGISQFVAAENETTAAGRNASIPSAVLQAGSAEFCIHHSRGDLFARRVIFCTGGRSLPRTGSDGAGWALVRRLGHTVTDTWAALVPLVLDAPMFHAQVSGLSHEAELSTFVGGKRVDRRTGSLLWTHFGISGPVVMDASRFWVIARGRNQPVELRCNFLPAETFEQAERWLIDMAAKRPRLSIGKLIAERFPSRLADALLHHVGIDPAQTLSQLSRDLRRTIVHALTALPLPVSRDRGWNYAEVTAGGVPLEEIDFRTMSSRKASGVYLAGEILDCDGRIGGFNFQWAWATGFLAGRAVVKSLGNG